MRSWQLCANQIRRVAPSQYYSIFYISAGPLCIAKRCKEPYLDISAVSTPRWNAHLCKSALIGALTASGVSPKRWAWTSCFSSRLPLVMMWCFVFLFFLLQKMLQHSGGRILSFVSFVHFLQSLLQNTRNLSELPRIQVVKPSQCARRAFHRWSCWFSNLRCAERLWTYPWSHMCMYQHRYA